MQRTPADGFSGLTGPWAHGPFVSLRWFISFWHCLVEGKKGRISPMKTAIPLSVSMLVLACFALPQRVQAISPPPDGGYPGGNTAEGHNALCSLTTGGYNTSIGFFSLRSNTSNSFNTALGAGALFANTADENTAVGAGTLLSNNTGDFNTANGAFALVSNTTGSDNTAIGTAALET